MDRLITIRDWDINFEKAQSRKIEGPMAWVAMPTKHDGKGYRRIMAHANGPAIYAVWCCLVQVAAKQKRRGVLADVDGPLTTFDIHLKTALPEPLIDQAVSVLSSKEIGWVIVGKWENDSSGVALHNNTGQDTTQQNRTSAPAAAGCPPELLKLIGWWNDLRGKSLVQAGVSADPPSEAVRRGWSRVERSPLLREKLGDLERLTDVIRMAPLCREGWFRLERLLGGKNRDGEFIIVKLLDGAYSERPKGPKRPVLPTPEEDAAWTP